MFVLGELTPFENAIFLCQDLLEDGVSSPNWRQLAEHRVNWTLPKAAAEQTGGINEDIEHSIRKRADDARQEYLMVAFQQKIWKPERPSLPP